MPDRLKLPSAPNGEGDPESPPPRFADLLRALVGRAARYSTLLSYVFPRRTTKLTIKLRHGEARIIIEYFDYSVAGSGDRSRVLREFPLLLRSPGLFDFPIAPRTSGEAETQIEAGSLGGRFEIFSRLSELKREAAAEQIPYSQQSEHDFFKFWLLNPQIARPYLFLLENGNLRALWKSANGEQAGLQFRGDELIQYVIFTRRSGSPVVSRSAGRELLSSIENLLEAHDANKLMLAAAAA